MIFQNGECRTWKYHQILQKMQENEESLAIFTVSILMATFGTKNVHSVLGIWDYLPHYRMFYDKIMCFKEPNVHQERQLISA